MVQLAKALSNFCFCPFRRRHWAHCLAVLWSQISQDRTNSHPGFHPRQLSEMPSASRCCAQTRGQGCLQVLTAPLNAAPGLGHVPRWPGLHNRELLPHAHRPPTLQPAMQSHVRNQATARSSAASQRSELGPEAAETCRAGCGVRVGESSNPGAWE